MKVSAPGVLVAVSCLLVASALAGVEDETLTDADRAALIGNYDEPPRIVKQTKPVFPKRPFSKRLEANIHVEFVVDEGGLVRKATVRRSDEAAKQFGPEAVDDFYEAAVAAVRQWRFKPALKDGKPVATIAVAPVSFRIGGKEQPVSGLP